MLTPQMRKYAQEFINKRDTTKSALAAGVSPKFAKKIGDEWAENIEVINYINAEIEASCKDTKITRDWVLKEAKKVYETSCKSPDRKAALELIHKIITQVTKDGDNDSVPTINIYTEKDINIL